MPAPEHLRPPDRAAQARTVALFAFLVAALLMAGRLGLAAASAGTDEGRRPAEVAGERVLRPTTPSTAPLRLRHYEVQYGATDEQRVRLDVPAVPSPVVVYIHGGGWTERRSEDLLPELATTRLLRGGWAIARVSFRLAEDTVSANDQVDDLQHALEVVRSLTQTAGLSGHTVLVGHSSGAHLALLLAFRDDPTIDHVIGVGGIYDFADDVRANPLVAQALPAALGCIPADCDSATIADLTPASWLGAGRSTTARLTLIHGALDPIAPLDGARRLRDDAARAGLAAELLVVAGAGHDVAEVSDAVVRSITQ